MGTNSGAQNIPAENPVVPGAQPSVNPTATSKAETPGTPQPPPPPPPVTQAPTFAPFVAPTGPLTPAVQGAATDGMNSGANDAASAAAAAQIARANNFALDALSGKYNTSQLPAIIAARALQAGSFNQAVDSARAAGQTSSGPRGGSPSRRCPQRELRVEN